MSTSTAEKFYKLRRDELLHLRKIRAINNAAFVYFALKVEDPFGDRQLEIQIAEFCLRWGLSESSLYKAIAALDSREVVKIRSRTILLDWGETAESTENSLPHSQQALTTRNRQKIAGSGNSLPDPENSHLYRSRARSSDSLNYLDSPLPPTGENLEGGGKIDLEKEQKEGEEKIEANQELEVSEKPCTLVEQQTKTSNEAPNLAKGGFPAAALLRKSYKKAENQDFPIALDGIPQPLLRQAERLGIKFDNEVVGAFKEFHQSQIGAALNAMDEYDGEITHPKGFFLSKVAKMPKDVEGMRQPLYKNDWMHLPAEPCPNNIKNELEAIKAKIQANRQQARRNC